MKKFNYQFYGSHVGRMNYGGAKFCRFALFPLMLLMLLLLPTRMVAETTTEDPRCALFKGLEGISDVTITDNGEYPWQMLDLKAEGMTAVSSYFTAESKGLMSSNYYNVDESTSVTEIKFKVSKPILLTSQVLVSSEEKGLLFINVDDKLNLSISGEKQTEYKVLLSAGEHSLELNYYHNGYSGSEYANRAFLYNLKTSTTIDDYVADYESSNNTLTFKKIKSDNLEDLDLSRIAMVNNEQTVSDMCTLLGIDNSAIKSVVFDKSFKTYAPTSLISFFADLNSLQTITDLEYLNTANVTNMSNMFYGCENLSSLDVTKFNTANVTKMLSMFESCSGLTSLDLTNFNTANVTDMDRMFFECSALTTIYASDKFVTTKVKHGCDMFFECRNLKKDYSESKTDHTYANCGTDGYFTPGCGYAEYDKATKTLTFRYKGVKPEEAYDLNVGGSDPEWKTLGTNVNKVVFDASFANARPTSCKKWFSDCSSLTDIVGIEYLNTEDVTDMSYMFYNCQNLNSLDLTSFNTAKVGNMSNMFYNCCALTTIYASDEFVTEQVGDGSNMFSYCTNLKGFIDYTSNSDKIDHTYANYKTGYFTKLVGKNGDENIGAAGETLAAENLVLNDDKDFVAYEPFTATAASYSRTINAGTTWATLCLPFEVSLDGQNFRAFKLLSADEDKGTVELEEIETNIAAGTPVIIKMKDGANSLSISVENKAIANLVKTAETADGNYQLQGLYTQKMFSKDTDNNCYIVKGAKLMNPAKLLDKTTTDFVGSKPFRAYMVDNSSAPAAGARMFSISIGGSTTAIEQLETTADSKAEYYDLQGRRLQDLQKGVNIVKRGGKTMKVIIK